MSVVPRRGAPRLVLASCAAAAALSVAPRARADDDLTRAASLGELLAYAGAHAPALKLSGARARMADAERARAAALLRDNPVVELGAGPRWTAAGAAALQVSASIAQPVELFGQRGLRRDVAERVADRLDAEAAAVRWSLRCDVAQAYAAASAAAEVARLAERAVAFAEALRGVAERRLAAGDASIVEVRVARAELADARQAKLGAQGELRVARVRLAEQIGWPVDSPPEVARAPEPPPLPSLAEALAAAVAEHPELRARRAALTEATARVALAEREAWPTPVLGVAFAREGDEDTALVGTVAVPLPLWHQDQAARAEKAAHAAVARAEAEAAEAALAAQVAAAHAEAAAAAERLSVLTASAAPGLEESLALLGRGLDAGELPLSTVIVARERLLAAERDTHRARADYARARAELERWVGAELSGDDHGGAR